MNENTTMTGSNDQSFNSALASPQQTPSNGINSSFQSQYQAVRFLREIENMTHYVLQQDKLISFIVNIFVL